MQPLLETATLHALPFGIVIDSEEYRVFRGEHRSSLGKGDQFALHDVLYRSGDADDEFLGFAARTDLGAQRRLFKAVLGRFTIDPMSDFFEYSHAVCEMS